LQSYSLTWTQYFQTLIDPSSFVKFKDSATSGSTTLIDTKRYRVDSRTTIKGKHTLDAFPDDNELQRPQIIELEPPNLMASAPSTSPHDEAEESDSAKKIKSHGLVRQNRQKRLPKRIERAIENEADRRLFMSGVRLDTFLGDHGAGRQSNRGRRPS